MQKQLRKIMAYVAEGWYTVYSIIKGHIVTIKNLFRNKVTVMYPEERLVLPDGYRGAPSLPVDEETGKDLCIGCGACARICPTQIITVEAHIDENKKRIVDKFEIDIGICTFCGFCEETCPVNAIVMSKEYELASFDKKCLVLTRERLNELGGKRPARQKPAAQSAAGKETE